MLSFDTLATLTLVLLLTVLLYTHRRLFTFHSFARIFYVTLYRTTVGLKTMGFLGKRFASFWIWISPFIIAIGFLGMGIVLFDLARSVGTIIAGTAAPTVGLVLPIKAKGVFYVPFLFWIISIFVIMVVHEGMHGVMARAYNLRVKNTGLVFLGALVPLIPGAFVEPDEKKLRAAPAKNQLAVYAAGPFANIVLGLLCFLLISAISPLTAGFYATDGVLVSDLMDGDSPAKTAGIQAGEKITTIDGKPITKPEEFSAAFAEKQPGDAMSLVTGKATYDIILKEHPETKRPWFGVYVEQQLINTSWWASLLIWIQDLFFWLFILNLGVGLFNLIPIGPIDGGRMLYTALERWMHPNRASAVWKTVSVLLLTALVTNIVFAFV